MDRAKEERVSSKELSAHETYTPFEPCPSKDSDITANKKRTVDKMQRELDCLNEPHNHSRSETCESLVDYSKTLSEYDSSLRSELPSEAWITNDTTFWDLNSEIVDIPVEKRVKRWAISIEELVSDPTGLQEFKSFLEKEYSAENIRFWIAVNQLRGSELSQVSTKVNEIYEEFVKPGAPFEINIDSKTMETILKELENPSRYTFDEASQHIFLHLLKKDCYPRFIRSDQFKRLLESGNEPSQNDHENKMTATRSRRPKRSDGSILKMASNLGSAITQALPLTGCVGAKKKSTARPSGQISLGDAPTSKLAPDNLGSARSEYRHLAGFAYELYELSTVAIKTTNKSKVMHSRSESSLSTSIREKPKSMSAMEKGSNVVCPWDLPDVSTSTQAAARTQAQLSVFPWAQENEITKQSSQRLTSISTHKTERNLQPNQDIRHQNTVGSAEKRKAWISASRSEHFFGRPSSSAIPSMTLSPTASTQSPPPLFDPPTVVAAVAFSSSTVMKDPPSSSDAEIEEELHKLSISERSSESSASDLQILPLLAPTPSPPPLNPPPKENNNATKATEVPCSETRGTQRPDSSHAVIAIEAIVQEVPIELIKSPQPLLELSTPTFQVQEACMTEKIAGSPITSPIPSPTRKRALKLLSLVKEEPEDDVESMESLNQTPDSKEDYEYDLSESMYGYMLSASRPALSEAPIAELDDIHDDDWGEELSAATPIGVQAPGLPTMPPLIIITTEEMEKSPEKRNLDIEKVSSLDGP